MKNIKKIVTAVLSLIMALGIFALPVTDAKAAAKATVTKAVHLYVGDVKDGAIAINFAEKGDRVKNLKTSSKNLYAKVVGINMGSSETDCTARIGLFAAKKGNYTVSFDIVNSEDKKISSHSVKIYANTERAIKSVKFAGGDMHGITNKTKGKLSVTMNKGYKLTKIVVETYDKNGERKSKTVKNNSTITLGKYPYFNESGEVDGNYYYMNTSIEASTQIRIYYTDKYTKSEDSGNYYMYRLAP